MWSTPAASSPSNPHNSTATCPGPTALCGESGPGQVVKFVKVAGNVICLRYTRHDLSLPRIAGVSAPLASVTGSIAARLHGVHFCISETVSHWTWQQQKETPCQAKSPCSSTFPHSSPTALLPWSPSGDPNRPSPRSQVKSWMESHAASWWGYSSSKLHMGLLWQSDDSRPALLQGGVFSDALVPRQSAERHSVDCLVGCHLK